MSVLAKDPLQVEPSPFEVLGVGVDASVVEVEARFKAVLPSLRDQRRRRAAMVARGALKDPVERELACLFHYDEGSGLRPCPAGDPGALQPARRAETATAWEQQLRHSPSDAHIAHGLAVLWYWWAAEDGPDPARARLAVAYWAMLATSDVFWRERRLGAVEGQVRARVIERLGADLRPAAGIEDVLASELAAARKIAGARVFLDGAQVVGGRLLLEHLGLADDVLAQRPDLADVLSPYAGIEDLIARGKVDTALEEIDNLPPKPAVDDLRARALIARAGQLASVREDDAALDDLEAAIGWARASQVIAAVRAEVASICCARAAQLGPDEAIALLERGLTLAPEDPRTQLALADRLTDRAIAAINAAVEERPTDAVAVVKGGVADLERAAGLGSVKAGEELPKAREALLIDEIDETQALIDKANAAADREDWQAAVHGLQQALDVGRSALPEDVRRNLEANLAIAHSNLATGLATQAADQSNDPFRALELLKLARPHAQAAVRLDGSPDHRAVLQQIDELLAAAHLELPGGDVLRAPSEPPYRPPPTRTGSGRSAPARSKPSLWWGVIAWFLVVSVGQHFVGYAGGWGIGLAALAVLLLTVSWGPWRERLAAATIPIALVAVIVAQRFMGEGASWGIGLGVFVALPIIVGWPTTASVNAWLRGVIGAAVIAIIGVFAVLLFIGIWGENEAAAPKVLAITAANGVGGKPTLEVPKEVPAGAVDVQLDNKSKQPRSAQIVKLDGGHRPEEALKAVNGEMPKVPDWLHAYGGAGITPPGQKGSATVLLPAGSYAMVDDDPKQQVAHAFKVTGSGTGALPSTDARVLAVKKGKDRYAFEPEGLKVGANKITFENKTDELHQIVAVPIEGNLSVAEVKKALLAQKGPPPTIDLESASSVAVIDSKQSEVATLNLVKPGRYAFICSVSARQTGKPHFLEGMLQEVKVQ